MYYAVVAMTGCLDHTLAFGLWSAFTEKNWDHHVFHLYTIEITIKNHAMLNRFKNHWFCDLSVIIYVHLFINTMCATIEYSTTSTSLIDSIYIGFIIPFYLLYGHFSCTFMRIK